MLNDRAMHARMALRDVLDGQRTDPDGVRQVVEAPGSRLLVVERDGVVVAFCQLLRYLSDPALRRRVTAATNKAEAFNGFSQWIGFGNCGSSRTTTRSSRRRR